VTTYERVVDGEVVERVTPLDGSHEDTRIGCLVLEGGSDWRVEGTAPAELPTSLDGDALPTTGDSAPPPQDDAPPPPVDEVPTNPTGADSAPDASDAGTTASEEPDGADSTDGSGAVDGGDKPRSNRRSR
jgi:hypothetical protein